MTKCTKANCGGTMVERVSKGEPLDFTAGTIYLECARCEDIVRLDDESEEEDDEPSSCGWCGLRAEDCVCDLLVGA